MAGPDFWLPETQARLNTQLKRVLTVMKDGNWRTLRDLATTTGDPPASVSARLRDLRNKWGFTVERLNMGHGLYMYAVTDPAAFHPEHLPG